MLTFVILIILSLSFCKKEIRFLLGLVVYRKSTYILIVDFR